MWSQQHSQWLDLLEGLLDVGCARHPTFFAARGVGGLTRRLILVRGDLLVHRLLCWLCVLVRDRGVLVLTVVQLGELGRELGLRRACDQTNLVSVLQEHQTRRLLLKHPTDRVPNFLLLQVCQQLFLPIPYISSLLI